MIKRQKKDVWKLKRKEKGVCIGKKKINVQFGRKINEDLNRNRKLF